MSSRLTGFLTIAVLVAMSAIFILNLYPLFFISPQEKILSYNGVRGIAIEHQGTLYTLNFEQQNRVIEAINRSLFISDDSGLKKEGIGFSKLIIYRFNAPDMILTPLGYQNNNLVYSIPEWNRKGYLLDISEGAFKELLSQTYD